MEQGHVQTDMAGVHTAVPWYNIKEPVQVPDIVYILQTKLKPWIHLIALKHLHDLAMVIVEHPAYPCIGQGPVDTKVLQGPRRNAQ